MFCPGVDDRLHQVFTRSLSQLPRTSFERVCDLKGINVMFDPHKLYGDIEFSQDGKFMDFELVRATDLRVIQVDLQSMMATDTEIISTFLKRNNITAVNWICIKHYVRNRDPCRRGILKSLKPR